LLTRLLAPPLTMAEFERQRAMVRASHGFLVWHGCGAWTMDFLS
jgi:hypothetical protein